MRNIFNLRFRTLKMQTPIARRGFTLLLAVLISSILLALGGAIFSIVSKQVVLSSSGRESQFAFFAADSGIECALYWDNKRDAFSTTSPLNQISCGGAPVNLTRTFVDGARPQLTTTFSFSYNDGNTQASCTDVRVTRNYNPTDTKIESYGHNTCDLASPLRLERAIRVSY